jgi:hypothetical protein
LFKHTHEADSIKAKVLKKKREQNIQEMKKPDPAGDRNESHPIVQLNDSNKDITLLVLCLKNAYFPCL